MMAQEKDLDRILDETAEGIRQKHMPSEKAVAASERVWAQLQAQGATSFEVSSAPNPSQHARSCDDLQSWIPAYLSRDLPDPRRLLLEDHFRECLTCRRALRSARAERKKEVAVTKQAPATSTWRWVWAAAAVLVLGVAVTQFVDLNEFLPAPSGPRATVSSVEGTVFRVSEKGNFKLQGGDEIGENDVVRVARGSRAVLTLSDGSNIELNERAQLSLSERRNGRSINLDRGNIIVEAAKQREGYLYVSTNDCLVSVKGTVFSVSHGTKGSRVSVIEGQVAVEHGGASELLTPGEQTSTHRSLVRIPVEREISWSKNAGRHIGLLNELTNLREQLEVSLTPEVHTSAGLLSLVPPDTVIYSSVPNLAGKIDEAYLVFQQRLAESPLLQQWWAENGQEIGPSLEDFLDRIQALGGSLGEEVVIGLSLDENNNPSAPFLMAEIVDQAAFENSLQSELDRIHAETETPIFVVAHDVAELPVAGPEAPYLLVGQGFVAASPSSDRLREIGSNWQIGESAFVGTDFYTRIAQAYSDGVSFLLAVDLQALLAKEVAESGEEQMQALQEIGITDARYFIAERKKSGDRIHTSAVVSFADTRKGIASWLAEPSPMGALGFVSPEASAVAAFAVKEPGLMMEELLGFVTRMDANVQEEIRTFEAQEGVNVVEDFAMPLGGEVVLALDGPILPEPAWKLVVEVYDAPRLQRSLEWLVQEVNAQLDPSLGRFEQIVYQLDGRTFYTLVSPDMKKEFHYVFVDGFLVVAPDRSLLLDAINFKQTGYTFQSSPEFAALLPEDGRADFSALLYQNFGPLLEPVANQFPDLTGNLDPGAEAGLKQFVSSLQPTLWYAYGEPKQITFAGTGETTTLLNLATVMSLAQELGIGDPEILGVPEDSLRNPQ